MVYAKGNPEASRQEEGQEESGEGFDVEVVFTGLGVVRLRSGGVERNPNPDGVELLLLRVQHAESEEDAEPADSRENAAPPSPPSAAPAGHSGSDIDHDHFGHGNGNGHDHGNGNGGAHIHAEPHLPRLRFRLDDLAEPDDVRFPLTAGTDGIPLVEADITDLDLTIDVGDDELAIRGLAPSFEVQWANRRPRTTSPGTLDFDAIPDLVEHFGLDRNSLPTDGFPDLYVSRVTLPPGRITTRHALLNPNRTPAEWVFLDPNQAPAHRLRPLADQVVWSRKNVKSLKIHVAGGSTFLFDPLVSASHGGNRLVTLAVTNMPGSTITGRVTVPEHFGLLQSLVSPSVSVIREIRRDPPLPPSPAGRPITTGGACPPARQETN